MTTQATARIDESGRILSTRHGNIDMRRRTALMGILNVTPDSFSDGGRYLEARKAIARGVELAEQGADIIDIGGESTRPGARPLSAPEEIERVVPVVRELRRVISIPLSIDTVKAEVARAALDAGADVVNDISALRFDPDMISLIVEEKVPVVLMHMQGTPRTMQESPRYQNVLQEVKDFLRSRVAFSVERGVAAGQIVIDPGIGFGKDLEHNLALIRGISTLTSLAQPVLVGPSRKTFIGKILNVGPDDRLEGSLAAAVAAALGGAGMIRMHDVKEARRAMALADAIRFGTPEERDV